MKKIIFYQDILEQKQTSGLITTLDELSIYYSTLDTITINEQIQKIAQ